MAAGYRARTGGSTAPVCMAWVVVRTSVVAILISLLVFRLGGVGWDGCGVIVRNVRCVRVVAGI